MNDGQSVGIRSYLVAKANFSRERSLESALASSESFFSLWHAATWVQFFSVPIHAENAAYRTCANRKLYRRKSTTSSKVFGAEQHKGSVRVKLFFIAQVTIMDFLSCTMLFPFSRKKHSRSGRKVVGAVQRYRGVTLIMECLVLNLCLSDFADCLMKFGFSQGVGIHGMEVYFPRLAVSQSELEKYMGAGEGKFTIG